MVIPQVEGKQSSPRHFFEDFTPLSRNRGRGSCRDEKISLADWSTVYGWNSFSKITKLEQDIGGEEKLDGHDETKNNLLKYMITLQKVWKLTANVLGINTVKIYKIFEGLEKKCVKLLKRYMMENKEPLHLKLA